MSGAMRLQSQSALGQAVLLIGPERLVRVDVPKEISTIELDDWRSAVEVLPPVAATTAERFAERIVGYFSVGRSQYMRAAQNAIDAARPSHCGIRPAAASTSTRGHRHDPAAHPHDDAPQIDLKAVSARADELRPVGESESGGNSIAMIGCISAMVGDLHPLLPRGGSPTCQSS